MSGPGRPRLSEQERHSRRVQRLKAELAQHGVIEKEMAEKEVEALRSQIDNLTAKIASMKSEYSRVKAQKDEELKSWFDERIRTVVNNQLLEYEARRHEMLRTLDSRIHEASERLSSLKSEIQEHAQQRDAIIKETGDLMALKTRFDNYSMNAESNLTAFKSFRSQMLRDLQTLKPLMDRYFGSETESQKLDFFRRDFRDRLSSSDLEDSETVFRRFYDLVKKKEAGIAQMDADGSTTSFKV